jgi:T-complex protein 1 subunit gamma
LASNVEGLEQLPYRAGKQDFFKKEIITYSIKNTKVAAALEVIPKTLAQNCGVDVVRVITELRAKHQDDSGRFFGINGLTGQIADMQVIGVWEPIAVRLQVIRTAIESACMLLRIDDVVSGTNYRKNFSISLLSIY